MRAGFPECRAGRPNQGGKATCLAEVCFALQLNGVASSLQVEPIETDCNPHLFRHEKCSHELNMPVEIAGNDGQQQKGRMHNGEDNPSP